MRFLLPSNLAALANTTVGHSAFALNCVRLEVSESGYVVAASTGRILVEVAGQFPDDIGHFPNVPGFEQAEDGGLVGLVPADSWAAAFKSIPLKSIKPILRNVAVSLGKIMVTFATTNFDKSFVLPCRLSEGKWPDYNKLFPIGEPKFMVKFAKEGLLDAIVALKSIGGFFSSPLIGASKPIAKLAIGEVIFSVWDKKSIVKFESSTSEGQRMSVWVQT